MGGSMVFASSQHPVIFSRWDENRIEIQTENNYTITRRVNSNYKLFLSLRILSWDYNRSMPLLPYKVT